MASTAGAGHGTGENGIHRTVYPAGLTYRLSQRGEIVRRWFGLSEPTVITHDLPAPWRGQTQRVLLTQIVGVRLAAGG